MAMTIPLLGEAIRQHSTAIPIGGITRQSGSAPHYRVTVETDEDNRIVAKCIDLQGVITDGANEDKALANVVEAIAAYLESQGKTKEFNLIVEPA